VGHIYKRGRKYWIKYSVNGRPFCETSNSTKESDAKRLLALREGDIANGKPIAPNPGRILLSELMADLVNNYKVNGIKSLKKLNGMISNHIGPALGHRRAMSIATPDLDAYIVKRLEEKAENGTINREMSAIGRAFSLGLKSGKIMFRPHVPKLQEDNVRKGFFDEDKFRSVIQQLPEDLRPVIITAYYTGWRTNSELLPMQWKNIDRKNGSMRLEPGTTKNKEGRTFHYHIIPELKDVIEGQWAKHEELARNGTLCPWVFFWIDGGVRPIKDFRKSWETACTNAGCPGMLVHDFRRTAVRNLERAGLSRSVATKLTGHKTEAVFKRYAIVDDVDLIEGVQKLAVSISAQKQQQKL
jgi:integrase